MEIDLSLKNRVTFLTLSGVNYTGYSGNSRIGDYNKLVITDGLTYS